MADPTTTAEPGQTTSEFKVLIVTAIANVLALAVDFGVKLSSQQQTDIMALMVTLSGLAGAYIVSRGVRKIGTGA